MFKLEPCTALKNFVIGPPWKVPVIFKKRSLPNIPHFSHPVSVSLWTHWAKVACVSEVCLWLWLMLLFVGSSSTDPPRHSDVKLVYVLRSLKDLDFEHAAVKRPSSRVDWRGVFGCVMSWCQVPGLGGGLPSSRTCCVHKQASRHMRSLQVMHACLPTHHSFIRAPVQSWPCSLNTDSGIRRCDEYFLTWNWTCSGVSLWPSGPLPYAKV
jgi:hypothetical protein